MNLADTAALAIASLDLLLVQDLVGAIRAADAGAQAAASSPLTPLPTIEPRPHIHPEPVYEPRRVVHLSPCYEPCREPRGHAEPLLHALPRVALSEAGGVQSSTGCETATKHESTSSIQPPWAVRAWQEIAKPPARVKVVTYRTDILSKGSLIDMFI